MKFFSLIFLVAGNLISVQASAHDITIQPLTRAECDRAAMAWDEKANVCQSGPGAITKSQPLTREECGKAGMPWLEDANVCGETLGTNQACGDNPEANR